MDLLSAKIRQLQAKGLTLVELMVVTVLLVGISGMLLATFLSGRASFLTTDSAMIVQQESRRAFDAMVRELREAGNVSTTTMTNGAIQLNFQIVRGYNDTGCANTICWGSEDALDGWVHYSIVGNSGNERQLIRCVNADESTEVSSFVSGCRVLANQVKHPNDDTSAAFAWSAANNEVTINLQIEYTNPALPTGSISTEVTAARVALRN